MISNKENKKQRQQTPIKLSERVNTTCLL